MTCRSYVDTQLKCFQSIMSRSAKRWIMNTLDRMGQLERFAFLTAVDDANEWKRAAAVYQLQRIRLKEWRESLKKNKVFV